MSLHTELLVLNPAPSVVFGMPVFASRYAALMRAMLRNHGEWADNPSEWYVQLSERPRRFIVRVEFGHSPSGIRYCELLAPHLPEDWTLHWPLLARKTEKGLKGRAIGSLFLSSAWVSMNDTMASLVHTDQPGTLGKEAGFWFSCDGAIALDLSELPTRIAKNPKPIVSAAMAQPEILRRLIAHAECCFLFHVLSFPSRAGTKGPKVSITPVRRCTLPGRAGFLYEANLQFVAGDNRDKAES